MADRPQRTRAQQIINGLNRGLVSDVLGAPVDLATMALNAPGQLYGAVRGQPAPYSIQRPVGGSDFFAGLLDTVGATYDDGDDTSLLEDAVRLGSGILGPAGVLKAPQIAERGTRAAGRAARAVGSRAAEAAEDYMVRSGLRPSVVEVVPRHLQGRKLDGLPDKVVVDGTEEIYTGFRPAQEAAERYMRDAGMNYNPPEAYVPVDVNRARRIADEYERMPHDPNNPQVRAAYQALADETMAQYEAMRRTGLRTEFMPPSGDPYGNPRNALKDIYQNNHMYVYPTQSGFGSSDMDVSGNPLLARTGEKWNGQDVLVNDVFRAVHDYFGHAKHGVGFRAGGEENAWQAHASMYSPLARRAATTETRGQNSWLNYGPHGDRNRTASTADTIFADQKTGLLPEWVSTEGFGGVALPRYLLEP